MKAPPFINRFGIVTMLILSTVLVLASFWVLEVMRRSVEDTLPQQQRVDPDYFVENFTFLRLSETGGVQYNIAGVRLEHDPVNGTHHVDLPIVTSYSEDRPPVKATSRRAMISPDNTQVHLYEEVHVDRPASPETKHFHLQSDYLLVLMDDDIVRTDKPVEITLGTSVLHGTGMVANNATMQLELFSNVRTRFAPPAQSR